LSFLAVLMLVVSVCGLQSCDYITGEKPVGDIVIATRLGGTQWKIISINKKDLLKNTYIYFQFNDDGSFWGYAGVNFIEGSYSVAGNNSLSFTGGIYTMIGSENQALVDQEKDFGNALDAVSICRLTVNGLEMNDSTGTNVLSFEQLPEYAMDPADLNGTKWRLSMVNEITIPADVSLTLSFQGDNKAVSKAGKYITDIEYVAHGDNLWIIEMRVVIDNPRNLFELEETEHRHLDYAEKIYSVVCYRLHTDKLEFFTLTGDTLVFLPE
jgi:heat shock protein HslJ